MAPDRNDRTPDDDREHGILSDSGSLETTSIGIVGGFTEQLSVVLPTASDDDFSDDDVVDDEVSPEEYAASVRESEASIGASSSGPTIAQPNFDEDTPVEDGAIETIHAELDEPEWEDAKLGEPETDEQQREASADLIAVAVAPEFASDQADDRATQRGALTPASSPDAEYTAIISGEIVIELDGDLEEQSSPPEDRPAHADAAPDDDRHDQEDHVTHADGPADPSSAETAAQPPADASTAPAARAATAPTEMTRMSARPSTGAVPTTRRGAQHPEENDRVDRAHAVERVQTRHEVTLASKRIGEFEPDRESSDLLTADRLLDPAQIVRPEPEGRWQHFVYSISGRRINLGDGKRARSRKELDRKISLPLNGTARFVPVLSRKGGVGKTTITTLLGMALADARDDRIIAIDANPDRGTLAERIAKTNGKTVRDLVRIRETVTGYNDVSSVVARDETRLDVLASDSDPRVSEALSDRDYHDVATLAAHYYSIVLTDTGTGIVHSVMGATLEVADAIVVVAGLSVDEARLASETLTWLETNGYQDQVRNAVVVLNTSRPGTPLVRQEELETHFRTRVRAVVRMPYDPMIAAGSAIVFSNLQHETRLAARRLAAAVVEGLRALAPAA